MVTNVRMDGWTCLTAALPCNLISPTSRPSDTDLELANRVETSERTDGRTGGRTVEVVISSFLTHFISSSFNRLNSAQLSSLSLWSLGDKIEIDRN